MDRSGRHQGSGDLSVELGVGLGRKNRRIKYRGKEPTYNLLHTYLYFIERPIKRVHRKRGKQLFLGGDSGNPSYWDQVKVGKHQVKPKQGCAM